MAPCASFTVFSTTVEETGSPEWVIRTVLGGLEVGGMSLRSEHLVVALSKQ